MKVNTDTDNQLVLTQSFIGSYVLGAIFILVGLYIAYHGIFIIGGSAEAGNHMQVFLFSLGGGSIFFIVGLVSFLRGGKKIWMFTKDSHELKIQNKLLRNKSVELYDLSKASKLVIRHAVETSSSSRGGSSQSRNVQYYSLQFTDGNVLDLGSSTKGFIASARDVMSGSSSLPVHINKIVAFTGVEVEHVNQGFSVGAVVDMFKKKEQ